jgi:chemotaxis protein MotB
MRSKKLICQLLVLLTASACVSKGKYRDLEASYAKSESRVSELEGKLGIESTAKTQLEDSVAEMKRALEELSQRKLEAEKRIAEFKELTAKFKPLVDAQKLSVRVVNGRMVVALSTDILFPSGSAKLSKAGLPAIVEVSNVLKSIEGKKFQIEGHTDSVPIVTAQYASNWELASARALSVLKTMVDSGMKPEQISAASFGPHQPIRPNDTAENKALNRRIEIVVVPDLTGLPGFDELQRVSGASPANAPAASSSPQS